MTFFSPRGVLVFVYKYGINMKARKILTCIPDTLWGIRLSTRSTGFGKNLFQTRVFRIGTIP